MAKFVIASVLLLITFGNARKLFYPDTKDPHAIVFEGPTNYKGPDAPDNPDIIDNEVLEDYSKLIDVRTKHDSESAEQICPPGFEMVGKICFPND